jgi:uncharacterized delta-60 repeat protein
MWFSGPRQTRGAGSAHKNFRPRLEELEDRRLLSAGALDPTFGSGGTVTTGMVVFVEVVEPNGKIVLGGDITNASGNGEWALKRFNPDGSVDTAFGSAGTVHAPSAFPGGINGSYLSGLAIDANNKIVAVGYANYEFAVARYNTDGSLDSTFGNGGFVLTKVTYQKKQPFEQAQAVAIQADGKIDVGGFITLSNDYFAQFALLRYNPDGTLDTSFGNQSPKNGVNITPAFGGSSDWSDMATALAIQADGNILLAGGTRFARSPTPPYPSMAVARYLSSGTAAGQLDPSFGTGGIATFVPPGAQAGEAEGILVQSNGAIVLGGYATVIGAWHGVLARLQTNGQLDTTFGDSGAAISSIYVGRSQLGETIAQGANGDLLISQNSQSTGAVEAYLPSGAVDTSFGSAGIATLPSAGDIATQPDGKVVIAGFNDNTMNRLLPSNTQIGWSTASPNPVPAGISVTLTAANINDNAYPNTTVTQVSFYLDTNDTLDGTDLLLGSGSLNAGVWTISVSTTGWAKGTYTLLAQAFDGSSYYAPISIQVTVF